MKTKTTKATHNGGCPPTDFGGPIGCLCTMILLPVLVVLLAHWAKVGHLDLDFQSIRKETYVLLFGDDDSDDNDEKLLLLKCLVGLLGWFGCLVVLWIIVPGKWVEGAPVIDPELDNNNKDKPILRLKYKLNGHTTFWIVMAIVANAIAINGLQLNDYLYKHYEKLAFMDIILCFGLSTFLYITSFMNSKIVDGKKTKKS